VSEQTYLNDALYGYLKSVSPAEPPLLGRLREETSRLDRSFWQISAVQGQFMRLLIMLYGAKRLLEVGTFTGYSAICMAEAMGPDGRLYCIDIDEDYTAIARRYWTEAGLNDRIELRLQDGVAGMTGLLEEKGSGWFDLVFIDADKANYGKYFELGLALVRRGGLIVVDNTLFSGRVVGQNLAGLADWQLAWTEDVKRFNEAIKDDPRIVLSMVPVGDGMSLCLKR
jgi:predicted O-methyltransferase YrrM